ncbi:hypothetical protein DFH07DRAFT_965501 [Mycena maculata]|uniref:Uncharacterized protein n=1 Tax=Mycena maculata TaxID=230809 RepID=A0AAD7N094_9AGAR|nr:hypothetical protein DFH07DRAFT_965501 [Mycena maculata]
MTIFSDVAGIFRAFRKGTKPTSLPTSEPVSSSDNVPTEESATGQPSLPVLPPEIWRTILAFLIRRNGRRSIRLEDPFLPLYSTKSSPLDDPDIWQDRTTLPLVCRAWRSMTAQIVFEYLRIRSIPQLRAFVEHFEEAQDGSLPFQGDWVLRIDFKIPEPLGDSESLVPRLLRLTPNLMIYVNQNGSDYRPETQTPSAVLEALAEHCGPSLRRLEWSHVGEAPAWCDLANLCQHAPNLRTLRLTWIFSYEKPFRAKMLDLPFLHTLSLGLIPDPVDTIVELPMTWDPLLNYLASDREMLPSLRRFDVEVFPTGLRFFKVHGAKIRFFRTTNWSSPPMLPSTLPLLSNLDDLVLTQSTEYVTLPQAHTTLRRICIAPFMEEHIMVPPRMFNSAVLRPLESVLLSIDSTKLPHLEEVRLRNTGILVNLVDEPAWLLKWAKRWSFRGVKFCDMHGQSFDKIQDPDNDPLLNVVRG